MRGHSWHGKEGFGRRLVGRSVRRSTGFGRACPSRRESAAVLLESLEPRVLLSGVNATIFEGANLFSDGPAKGLSENYISADPAADYIAPNGALASANAYAAALNQAVGMTESIRIDFNALAAHPGSTATGGIAAAAMSGVRSPGLNLATLGPVAFADGIQGVNLPQPQLLPASDPRSDNLNPSGGSAFGARTGATTFYIENNPAGPNVDFLDPIGSSTGQAFNLTPFRVLSSSLGGLIDDGLAPGSLAGDLTPDFIPFEAAVGAGSQFTARTASITLEFFDRSNMGVQPDDDLVARYQLFDDTVTLPSVESPPMREENFNHDIGNHAGPIGVDDVNDATDGLLLLGGELRNARATLTWTEVDGDDAMAGFQPSGRFTWDIDFTADVVWDEGKLFDDGLLDEFIGSVGANWRNIPFNLNSDGTFDLLGALDDVGVDGTVVDVSAAAPDGVDAGGWDFLLESAPGHPLSSDYDYDAFGGAPGWPTGSGANDVSFVFRTPVIEPAAKIEITPDDTNQIGDPHTFTVTVMQDDGLAIGAPGGDAFDGFGPAANETVTVTLDGINGAVPDLISPDDLAPADPTLVVGVTDANGQFQVTFSSITTGQVIGSASANVVVGAEVFAVETDGLGDNSGPATKTFVDAKIVIDADATNQVGDPHTFTATVFVDDGTGTDADGVMGSYDAVGAGESVSISLVDSNGAVSVPSTPLAGLTDANGQFEVTFTSFSGGVVIGSATTTVTVDGVVMMRTTDGSETVIGSGVFNSDEAEKVFVDAKITIGPDGVNPVGDPHTFTTIFWVDDGSGTDLDGEMGNFDRVQGADITVTISNHDGAVADPAGPFIGVTDADGEFDVTFTSLTEGTNIGTATGSILVGGVLLTRTTDGSETVTGSGVFNSDAAEKIWVDEPQIDIEKFVKVVPDEGGGEGLTPGFWKTHSRYGPAPEAGWDDTGYDPDDDFNTVFGVTDVDAPTLIEALDRGGGGLHALGRHATAALLNAANPNVDYAFTVDEVIALTQAAYASGDPQLIEDTKNSFAIQNELGADLDTPANGGGGGGVIGFGEDADEAPGIEAQLGDQVMFTYFVSNPGEVPLTNVVVVDDNATPDDPGDDFNPDPVLDSGFNVGDDNIDGLLDPDEVWLYTWMIVADETGQFTNIAKVTGESVSTGQMVMDDDPANYFVDELPPPPPSNGEGLTPGFWKQPHHFIHWIGYATNHSFDSVFGVTSSNSPTLLQALDAKGGGEFALQRHAVAALLNAASPEVSYAYTTAQIIAIVQQAYASGDFESAKNLFEAQNELGNDTIGGDDDAKIAADQNVDILLDTAVKPVKTLADAKRGRR